MYPNEARLKNLTYKSNIFVNVGIQYILHDQDKYIIKNLEKVMFEIALKAITSD